MLSRRLSTGLLSLLLAATAPAQQDSSAPTLTLHIATDLLQIPVLVVSRDGNLLPPVAPSRFTLAINGGTRFQPLVRGEGNEPITLAILVDHSGAQPELLNQLPTVANAFVQALHPEDRLLVDSLDHCLLHHLLPPAPPIAGTLTFALKSAIEPTDAALTQKRCGDSNHLMETVALVAQDLARLPGHRILLVVTDGHDTEKAYSWRRTRDLAVLDAVTIFSLTDSLDNWRQLIIGESESLDRSEGDELAALCAFTGGINLTSTPAQLTPTLLHLITLLRNRYIIEFPRPTHLQALNTIDVQVKNFTGLIRSSGISFPGATTPDPAAAALTRSQPRPTPGTRSVLQTH